MPRGGRRRNAGRPKGSRTKNPIGNKPRFAAAELAVSEYARIPWRQRNRKWVEENLDSLLGNLEKKATETGDHRLGFAVAQFRASYAFGTPAPEREPEQSFSEIFRSAAEAIRDKKMRQVDRITELIEAARQRAEAQEAEKTEPPALRAVPALISAAPEPANAASSDAQVAAEPLAPPKPEGAA